MAKPRRKTGRDRLFGFDKISQLLDASKFGRNFKRNMGRAQNRVGAKFQALARDRISSKNYDPNAPLTVMLKGSSTPLVDKGDLYGSVTWNATPFKITMGVNSRRLPGGRLLAELLHNGATIRVTPAMRRAVFAKMSKSQLNSLPTLQPKKEFWVIPPRPFLAAVFNSSEWRKFTIGEYVGALRATLKQQLPGGN